MPRRQYQVYIDCPPESVWAFHTDLSNHARTCPPEQREQIVKGLETPLSAGARVVLRARHGGFWRTLEAEIADWNPPAGFTSRQVRGPFKSWTHRHRFAPFQRGTLMTDQIEYRLRFGPLGSLVDRLWLGRHLDRFFRYRHQTAKHLLEQENEVYSRAGLV